MSDQPKEDKKITIFWVWENCWYIPPEASKKEKHLVCQTLSGPFLSLDTATEGRKNLEKIHFRLEKWLKNTRFSKIFGSRFNNIAWTIKEEVVPSAWIVDQFPDDMGISRFIFHGLYNREGKNVELIYLADPEYRDLAYIKLTSWGFLFDERYWLKDD